MDNAIRTALDTWAKLIKELSFDERVGFITAQLTFQHGLASDSDFERIIASKRSFVYQALIDEQSKQLQALDNRREPVAPSTQIKAQMVKVIKPHATREQLITAIDKAVKRAGYGDVDAAKDIQRYARQLERIENAST